MKSPLRFVLVSGLAALLALAGCDLFGGGEHYLEGEVIPGTARTVEISDVSGYYPGEARPKISPDGEWVVFSEGRMIYVLDLATGERQELTTGRNADWSPDGKWLAFSDGRELFKVRRNGSERIQLTSTGSNFYADWSPDGMRIAYDRSLADETGPAGVWVMRADGFDKRPLFGGGFPDWHPDGQRLLALRGIVDNSSLEAVVYDLQTDHEQEIFILPSTNASHSHPRYSPDGSRLVYGAASGIWVAAADGSWARRILPNDLYQANDRGEEPRVAAASPSWHPDGRRIVYEHLAITAYETPTGLSFGSRVQGEMTLRLLDVEAALEASTL